MMKRPHCQAESDRVGCHKKCGQCLQAELVAPRCNHPNTTDIEFCEDCGHSIKATLADQSSLSSVPSSFANSRYWVKKFPAGAAIRRSILPLMLCARQGFLLEQVLILYEERRGGRTLVVAPYKIETWDDHFRPIGGWSRLFLFSTTVRATLAPTKHSGIQGR